MSQVREPRWRWWRIALVAVLGFGLPIVGAIRAVLVLSSPASDEGRRSAAVFGLVIFTPLWLAVWIWLIVMWVRRRDDPPA